MMEIPMDVLRANWTGQEDLFVVYNFDFSVCTETVLPGLKTRLGKREHGYFKFAGNEKSLTVGEEVSRCPW